MQAPKSFRRSFTNVHSPIVGRLLDQAYQAGSTYAANNENPGDPKTMSKAAYQYAKDNPEDVCPLYV
jgi:hypothetical protein